jgi:5-methyltetrahydropteroyltriglutamate--homocysteine methyltransferase
MSLPLFPVTVVGSFPRPEALRKSLRRGGADADVLEQARVEVLALQEAAGVDIISEGEQGRDSFFSFIATKLGGVRLMSLAEMLDWVEDKAAFERLLAALDVPAFAIKNPVVEGKLSRKTTLAGDELAWAKSHTGKPVKVALPGPYLLSRSMWVKRLSADTYPTKESLGADVVAVLRAELIALRDAGADFVQFDEPVLSEVAFAGPHATHSFMCAALSEKASPESELEFAVELINQVVEGVEGIRTGLHVCRGNWSRDESVLLAGPYDALVPYFARMKVNQLVLEYATERAGSFAPLAALPDDKEIGLGLVNPRTSEIEPVEQLVARVQELLSYRPAESIFLNPDCGFGTFSDRPINTLDVAQKKLESLSLAAQTLRE